MEAWILLGDQSCKNFHGGCHYLLTGYCNNSEVIIIRTEICKESLALLFSYTVWNFMSCTCTHTPVCVCGCGCGFVHEEALFSKSFRHCRPIPGNFSYVYPHLYACKSITIMPPSLSLSVSLSNTLWGSQGKFTKIFYTLFWKFVMTRKTNDPLVIIKGLYAFLRFPPQFKLPKGTHMFSSYNLF